MAYEIDWVVQNRIVSGRFVDVVSVSEARESSNVITEYVVSGDAPVHLIADLRDMIHSPTSIQVNRQIASPYLNHPNMGWVIIIGGNAFQQFMISVLKRLTSIKVKQTGSYEEALDMLKEIDPSIEQASID